MTNSHGKRATPDHENRHDRFPHPSPPPQAGEGEDGLLRKPLAIELILGGARSGKSALAERLARESYLAVTYIATATAGDDEMAQRIHHHRARRPAEWRVAEEPIHLAAVLRASAALDRCLIVDCLTLWLNNLLAAADETLFRSEREALLQALPNLPGRILLVSNEVGMGIVPLGELSRRFCDEAGRLHQDLAQICDRVVFVAAGLPLVLKGTAL